MSEELFFEQKKEDKRAVYRERQNSKYLSRVEELKRGAPVHPLSRYIGMTFQNPPGRRSKSPPVKTVVAVRFRDCSSFAGGQVMVGYTVPGSDEVCWMLAPNFKVWVKGAVRVKDDGGLAGGG